MKLFKKMLNYGVILAMSISIVGCSTTSKDGEDSNKSVSATNKLEEIKERGKLIVATSAEYPPYEFHKMIDGKDTIVGLDPSIAKEIANKTGVDVEFMDMDFDGVIGAINANKADLVLAGMSPTEKRKKSVDFSDVYYREKKKILVRKGDENIGKTEEEVKNIKIGVQKGSIEEIFIVETLGSTNVTSLAKVPDLILELQNGNIDGILTSENVIEINLDRYEGIAVANSEIGQNIHQGAAIAFKKGDENKELVELVNETLKELNDAGKIDSYMSEARKIAKSE